MLSRVEHEKSFITSGPGLGLLVGKFCKFLTVICTPNNCGGVLFFFFLFYTREITFVTSCLISCPSNPLLKRYCKPHNK